MNIARPPIDVSDLRHALRRERELLVADFLTACDPRKYFAAHMRLIDRTLCSAAARCFLPEGTTLAALGGYGRGEQYPHSDVDVLIVPPAPLGEPARRQLEPFVNALYSLGLDMAPTVRTIEECVEDAREDITLQTSLLEMRWIFGSSILLQQLRMALETDLDIAAFYDAKRLEQALRHHHHQDSPYNLEPNLKEAPGGLRDLHVIRWLGRASGLGTNWRELARRHLITPLEGATLQRLERSLQLIRIRLHLLSSRKNDWIRFESQRQLAAQFGVQAAGSRRADEIFMQQYYRTAQTITQLNDLLLQNIGTALRPTSTPTAEAVSIDDRFKASGDLLDLRSPDLFEREPEAIFESFLILGKHPEYRGMSARMRRALWHARCRIDAPFRRDPDNRRRFIEILQQPRGIVHALRWMNQYGVLGRYLPAFRKIVGQMQHDHYHIYTVDQHTLTVISNLRRFTMEELAHEFPFCSRLMAGFERPWLLYVAALFHDIAKGRGGDHSLLGKREALRFCRAHDFAEEDTQLVTFLVEHHLALSFVSQRQDLSDAHVIREFAALVQSERRLVALYLLTVADIRGTDPKVWSAWKEKLLDDLFHATWRVLRGQARLPPDELEVKRGEALHRMNLWGFSRRAHRALWRELDTAYFLQYDANTVAWHTRTLHYRVSGKEPVVKARLAPIGEGIEVLVYCPDQPQLFARMCGFFGVLRFTVVEAKIQTTRHGYALDTFLVLSADRNPYCHAMVDLIEQELQTRLALGGPLPALSRSLVPRRLQVFPLQPEVSIRSDENGRYHVLTVSAADRHGLLYDLALVLARGEIAVRSAKIVTLGQRAEDTFVIEGAALKRPEGIMQIQTELLEKLR